MAPYLLDPSPAYVLGTLADLKREAQATQTALAGAQHNEAPLTQALEALAQQRQLGFALRSEANSTARKLGEQNQLRAEWLPKLAKLTARSESLRLAQAAEPNPEAARALRRSRAVVNVQMEDLQRDSAKAEAEAEALRQQLHQVEAQLRANRAALEAAHQAVATLQTDRPGLLPRARLCALKLAIAHGQLRLCGPTPSGEALETWSAEVRAVCAQWLSISQQMGSGRFRDEEVQALMGGRSFLSAEVIAAFIALGEPAGATEAFGHMCGGHGFLHQIFHVYRAHALGLVLAQDRGPLIEVLRLHRYEQGLRGTLAACLWHLLGGDEAAFNRQLPRVVQQEAQLWEASELPGVGLISLMGCALTRLGRTAGFAVPANLGPTVPLGPWWVASPAEVR